MGKVRNFSAVDIKALGCNLVSIENGGDPSLIIVENFRSGFKGRKSLMK